MTDQKITLAVLPDAFAICRLQKDERLPAWALTGDFVSITRTSDELSIVCRQAGVAEDVKCERGWRCLKVEGTLDFSLTGILAALLQPLAQAKISIFAIATFDTDYLLVKETCLENAINVLSIAGYRIRR
jgi:hypothetical protein